MQKRHSLLGGAVVCALAIVVAMAPSLSKAQTQSVNQEIEALRGMVGDLLQRIEELERQQQQTQEEVEKTAQEVVKTAEEVEKAVAEAPRVEPSRKPPVRLEISGRINQAYLFADNGNDSQSFVIDNDNSGSRFGFRGEADIGETTAGAYLELGFEVNTTDEISFGNDGPVGDEAGESDFLDVRHAEWYLENENYGTFWLGFGNIATENVSEVDLSGTGCCFSESDVDDLAGGLEFETGQEIDTFFSNLDGNRTSRIRYDSPRFAGFQVAVAGRQENERIEPDASINYAAEVADWRGEIAGGWRPSQDANTIDENSDTFHGSASVLAPFGLNLTAAGGVETFEDNTEDELFFFGKVGWRGKLFSIGETRVSLDYFYGEDVTNAFGDAANNFSDPVEAHSIGGGVVQVVSNLSTEFYIGARSYWIELPAAANQDDPDSLIAITSGARVRF